MILHLFPKSLFAEGFIYFINKHFDSDEHSIILYTNKPFDLPDSVYEYDNVADYDGHGPAWLYGQLKRVDKVFIHNLGLLVKELALLAMSPSVCKKTIWMSWGSDLYCYKDVGMSLSDKIVEAMRGTVIRRFSVIATLTEGDYQLIREWYGSKARNIRLDYSGEQIKDLMDGFMAEEHEDDGITRILLGNSATASNQHKEALDLLSKYKDENIEICIPLSYGEPGYAKEVIEYGRRIFGDKISPLTELMTKQDYYHILSRTDIGVFDHNRQQGIGNITALLYYGKKVYIRDDISTWEEWVNKKGYLLECIKKIEYEDYDSFIGKDEEKIRKNKELVSEYYDTDKRVKEWEEAFGIVL